MLLVQSKVLSTVAGCAEDASKDNAPVPRLQDQEAQTGSIIPFSTNKHSSINKYSSFFFNPDSPWLCI
jgi:hypothetical protein